MIIYTSSLDISGAALEDENLLPIFRSANPNLAVESISGLHQLKPQDTHAIGQNAGFRVLPYRMQDRYSRKRHSIQLKTIILENNILRATFLPDYGARLYSLYHKTQERELLFCNPVFQLANLAIRNAWFSGGIEWNVSQYGHSFSTCSPLFAAKLFDQVGTTREEFLRFYHFERCKELFWAMDFHLPKNSETLHLYVKITNPKDCPESMYWWTNIAITEEQSTRIFSEDARVLYMEPQLSRGFGQAELPNLPILSGGDASFPSQFQHSCEYFFQNDSKPESPWEAAIYDNGRFFFERSSSMLRYRKMFCWGTHRGGQRWKDFLSNSSAGNYIEIQSGLAPTQLHGLEIPPQTSWDFVQVFGAGNLDNLEDFYQENWSESSRNIKGKIEQIISTDEIQALYQQYKIQGELRPDAIIHSGEGWAALEVKKQGWAAPTSMIFPESSLNAAQSDWLHLLEKGFLAEPDDIAMPVPSWMSSSSWLPVLEASFNIEQGDHWYSRLHLGVFYYENFMHEKALAEWQKSLERKENPLAYRNLAYHHWKNENLEQVRHYYQAVFALKISNLDKAYTEEYLEVLLNMQRYAEVWEYYQQDQLKEQNHYKEDRLAVLVGRAAVELDHNGYVEELLSDGYPQLREGENLLMDIWYILEGKKEAAKNGCSYSEEWRAKVTKEKIPPMEIDFRMGAYKSFDKKF